MADFLITTWAFLRSVEWWVYPAVYAGGFVVTFLVAASMVKDTADGAALTIAFAFFWPFVVLGMVAILPVRVLWLISKSARVPRSEMSRLKRELRDLSHEVYFWTDAEGKLPKSRATQVVEQLRRMGNED